MKKILCLTSLVAGMMIFNAAAEDAPKEINLGILGGQNATQQIGDNMCVKEFLDKELNVKLIYIMPLTILVLFKVFWAGKLT